MSRQPVVIEARWSCQIGIYNVRLWIKHHTLSYLDPETLQKLEDIAISLRVASYSLTSVLEKFIEEVPELAAIEVLDQNGEGTVAYMEWP